MSAMPTGSSHDRTSGKYRLGRVFLKWFLWACAVQLTAWLLMFSIQAFRPIYFGAYYPVSFLFPGPYYPRYGTAFFLIYLPLAGTTLYSAILGALAVIVHKKRMVDRSTA